MRYARHVRHRKPLSRAQLIAQNLRRRGPVLGPEPERSDAPPEAPEPQGTGYVGYHIEERGSGWYALIGPDGKQVGKASRDRAELYARIPGADR